MSIGELHSRDLSRGDLGEISLVEILGCAYARQLTGRLDLSRDALNKEIYFLNGLPIFVTSRDQKENLLEVGAQVKNLGPEEVEQLRTLQKERGVSTVELFKMLDLMGDAEIYALQVETFMQRALEACGWQEGTFQFNPGEDLISSVPLFDLNPLELIYQGIKTFHSLDLASELQEAQAKKARIKHGWEETLALPEIYYQRSDVLDLFEKERTIGESIPRLSQEFGDINEAMLFLYVLLVTGLLQIVETTTPPETQQSDRKKSSTPAAPAVEGDTFYVSTKRRREEVRPLRKAPLLDEMEPAAPMETGPIPEPPALDESELREIMAPTDEPKTTPATGTPSLSDPPMIDDIVGQDHPPTPTETLSHFAPPDLGDLLPPSAKAPPPDLAPPPADAKPERIIEAPPLDLPPIDEPAPAETDRAPGDGPPPIDEIDMSETSDVHRSPDAPVLDASELEEVSAPEDHSRLVFETKGRLEAHKREFNRALDYYELLGVDVDTAMSDIQLAFERLAYRLSLDKLPEAARPELQGLHDSLRETIESAAKVLTNPDERIQYEQKMFLKRVERADTMDMKQKLAIRQWMRGKWYLESANRADLARKCFHQAIELDPKQPHYFTYVGWAVYRGRAKDRNIQEARDYLGDALAINPGYDQAHYFLGVIAKREGDKEQAQIHFKEALRANPDHPQARREVHLTKSHTKQVGVIGRIFGKNH